MTAPWMDYTKWFEWLQAHTRDGESLMDAAKRLAVTYSFLDVYGSGEDYRSSRGSDYRKVAKLLNLNGTANRRGVAVHRAIYKYKLHELA